MEQLRLFQPPEPGRRRNQRGAELVEFALVFPVLMLFVIAALSLLWMGFIKVAAAQAAKEAARDASVPIGCPGDVGPGLIDIPSTTVPTLPSITTTSITLPGGVAQGAEVRPQMRLASYQVSVPTTIDVTTTSITLPVTTTSITLPPTTTTSITVPPTTTTSVTLPPTTTTSVTVPSTTTSTTKPPPPDGCTPNFRTYPRWYEFNEKVSNRFPVFGLGIGQQDLDVVYKYNDPNCADGLHSPPQNSVPRCATPLPNDPPSNAKVSVTITKPLPAPLRFFAGIFGAGDTITAHAGGETRGE